MEQVITLLKRYKWYLLFFLIFIPLIVFLFTFSLKKRPSSSISQSHSGAVLPTPTPLSTGFSVTQTTPQNEATDVPAGESLISFTTDSPITSPQTFVLSITPPTQYGFQYLNSYPTKQVQAIPLGGLRTSTFYTVTVRDQTNTMLYTWSFTTSSTPAQSQSATRVMLDKQIDEKYYPLQPYLPYNAPDFTVQEYSDHLTLKVLVKNPDTEKVKTEVTNWIKSKGIDPTTHTINYINDF